MAVHDFDWPDRLVVGTVGLPGARTFYLQARAGDRLVSASLEKEQSALLAEKIDEVLDEIMAAEGNPFSVPPTAPEELRDSNPLDSPVVDEFRIGTMTLGFDPTTGQLVIEAFPLVEDSPATLLDDETNPDEAIRIRVPVGAARSFSQRTRDVVLAGRPACPVCLLPMDPEGHDCPGTPGFV